MNGGGGGGARRSSSFLYSAKVCIYAWICISSSVRSKFLGGREGVVDGEGVAVKDA